MLDERVNQPFIELWRDGYEHQMISSRSGNLSSRLGDRFIIQAARASLAGLQ
jgi:hypothetical protein